MAMRPFGYGLYEWLFFLSDVPSCELFMKYCMKYVKGSQVTTKWKRAIEIALDR